jgi:hypothetical protein
LIQRLAFLIFTTMMCGKTRLRMYSEILGRIGQAKKILELLSAKQKPVDISE